MYVAKTAKRTAFAALAAAAVLVPATAASAQDTEIPEEGWEYSEQWDFVQDEYTAEFQADVDEALAEHFADWGSEAGLEATRLQNYYIDGVNETPVQRKFKVDFWGDSGNDGLEAGIYLPGGITPGIQDSTGGEEYDAHYLLRCTAADTACETSETEDGDVVAYTTDGTYVEAAVFHEDGSVSWAWFGAFEGETDVTPDQLVAFVLDLDTEPVWHALEND
ncbi:hypothetical protein [Glycomyces artemisiae]|uniref:Uncharacterized protein n=1 Tax=Glycomyces artemisiae TaxID=1076443 RepID=A0A2T0U8M4_9ACTN|nr:hypothetical protein [Glycomyces artemisiae]PRY54222.1 hypothetical protein B0I28_11577 [Glycomyces artemisiae]